MPTFTQGVKTKVQLKSSIIPSGAIPTNLGTQFATLGANVPAIFNILTSNVLTFICNLGKNNKPKMLKLAPSFFSPHS
jgi:hypothetical protein